MFWLRLLNSAESITDVNFLSFQKQGRNQRLCVLSDRKQPTQNNHRSSCILRHVVIIFKDSSFVWQCHILTQLWTHQMLLHVSVFSFSYKLSDDLRSQATTKERNTNCNLPGVYICFIFYICFNILVDVWCLPLYETFCFFHWWYYVNYDTYIYVSFLTRFYFFWQENILLTSFCTSNLTV